MRWSDQAIILSLHKFSENSAVVKLFSRQHGIYSGAVRSISNKANRGIYQPGNVVQAVWSARLEEQLGNLHSEMDQPVAAFLMRDNGKLLAMTSALALTGLGLAERDPHPTLYDHLYYLLQRLCHQLPWHEEYIRLELVLLAECGFGLELDSCVVTGTCDNLTHVSPRSGCAVSKAAAQPYLHKLLKLPEFLHLDSPPINSVDIIDGLQLTGYFLENWLLEAHHHQVPFARTRLAALLTEHYSKTCIEKIN